MKDEIMKIINQVINQSIKARDGECDFPDPKEVADKINQLYTKKR